MALATQTLIGKCTFKHENTLLEARFYEDKPGDLSTLKADIFDENNERLSTLESNSIRLITYTGTAPIGKHIYKPISSCIPNRARSVIESLNDKSFNYKWTIQVKLCPEFLYEDGIKKRALFVRDTRGMLDRGNVGNFLPFVNKTAFPKSQTSQE